MKLTLKNFRCYEDAEFELERSGTTLISGASGSGKTTVVQGVIYALYGGRKPFTHGTRKCCVKLRIDDCQISRSAGPNSLKVTHGQKSYSDADAQTFINRKFGSQNMFLAGSVAKYDGGSGAFLAMSYDEKLAFFESLVMSGDASAYSSIMNCLKERFKTARDQVGSIYIEHKLNKNSLEKITKELELYEDVDDSDQTEKSETLQKRVNALVKERELLLKYRQSAESTSQSISELNEKLSEISKSIVETEQKAADCRRDVLDCEPVMEAHANWIKYQTVLKSYEAAKKDYENDKTAHAEKLTALILSPERSEEIGKKLSRYSEKLSQREKIAAYDEVLEFLDNELPETDDSAVLQYIQKVKDLVSEKVQTFTKINPKKIQKKQRELKNILSASRANEATLAFMCKEEQLPSSLTRLHDKCESLKCEQVESCKSQLEQAKKNFEQCQKELHALKSQKKDVASYIASVSRQVADPEGRSAEQLGDALYENREETKLAREKISKSREIQLKQTTKKRFEREQTELSSEVALSGKKILALEEKLDAISTLQKLVKSARSSAIQEIVMTIKLVVNRHLEHFFEDVPMTADVIFSSKTKTEPNKLQITLCSNGEPTTVNELSSGEFQRVNLAFILALNEISGSDMLYIDEFLNNLDQKTSTSIIEYVKKQYPTKQIVVISHDATIGIFDNVLKI